MPTSRRRGVRPVARAAGCGFAALAALALAACGASSAADPTSAAPSSAAPSSVPTAPVLATAGDLRVAAGYVPAPASPDVAAAYFTVVDTGTAPDTLLSATSDASRSTTLHRTQGGAMVMLDGVTVPAGGTAVFSPGADHLMLEGLTRTLTEGGRVTLRLTFATAGVVTVTLPVTGYPTGGGLPSAALSPLPSTTAAP